MELKELAPKICDRVKLRQLITKHQQVPLYYKALNFSLTFIFLVEWYKYYFSTQQHQEILFLPYTIDFFCGTLDTCS